MIEAEGLTKHFGATVALAGVSFAVPRGAILGLLGPNGAGKTTALRILTTLTMPDAGKARVAGFDVVHNAAAVRRNIGVAAQDATLDETLTGRQNLEMVARLSGLARNETRRRATELLEQFELVEATNRVLKEYSGGMRRRLDVAASLVARPPVLFFDEPTTGLDPSSRARVWNIIRDLVAQGSPVLLTTQYLDEADRLADRIVVMNHGLVIANGTSAELKARTGEARLEVTLNGPHPEAAVALGPFVIGDVQVSYDGRQLRGRVRTEDGLATTVVRALDNANVMVDDVVVHQASLDDVFFALTDQKRNDIDENTGDDLRTHRETGIRWP